MKYVILENSRHRFPLVFGDAETHAYIAANFIKDGYTIVGAGFCDIDADHNYFCYGHSVSLATKSSEQDSRILNAYLRA